MITNYSQSLQSFSHDMYVRLRAADMAKMEFKHLYSETTGPAHSPLPTGVTEWTGLHGKNVLSLAWDWVYLNDGMICLPNEGLIRTNIMLVDASGYDTGPAATDKACISKIATLDWQEILHEMLQSRGLI